MKAVFFFFLLTTSTLASAASDKRESLTCEKLIRSANQTCVRYIEQADDVMAAMRECIEEEMKLAVYMYNVRNTATPITCGY